MAPPRKDEKPESPAKKDAAPAGGDPLDTMEPRLRNALAYIILIIPFGFLLPLYVAFVKKDADKDLRFHSIQSLLFCVANFIACIALFVVLGPIGLGLSLIAGCCGAIVLPVWLVYLVIALGAWLFLCWKTYSGEKVALPVIGPMAEQYAGK